VTGVIHVRFRLGRLSSREPGECSMERLVCSEEAGISDDSNVASENEDGVGAETGSKLDRSTGLTSKPERMDSVCDLVAASFGS